MDITIEIERLVVVVRLWRLVHEISHGVFRQIEVGGLAVRLSADDHVHPAAAGASAEQACHYGFTPGHISRKEWLPIAHRAAIDLRHRRCLRAGEAICAIGAWAADGNVTPRVEVALARIVDQTVFEAV